jgi:hypothetical protein
MQVKSTNNRKIGLVIVSIIVSIILFRFVFPIFGNLIIIPVSLIVILFIIGFGVGKYFPKGSWIVLIVPTIPWIYYWWTVFESSRISPNAGFALVIGAGGLILYIFVFIGFRFGVWAAKRKDATTKIIISE